MAKLLTMPTTAPTTQKNYLVQSVSHAEADLV